MKFAHDGMFIGAALGESRPLNILTRPLVLGPHEVGGAEPGAERR
jgi:hypothetical protein